MANPNPNRPLTVASSVLKIQLHLLEAPSTPFDRLIAASTLLSKSDYDSVVTERTISDLCGHPSCPNPLPSISDRDRKGRYRVSLGEHRVYDLQETYSYCSEECLIGSRAFKESLSEKRRADVEVSRGKLEGFLRSFGCFDGGEEEEVKRGRNLKLEIKEKEDVKAGDVEMIGPANAIEGYVPQFDRGSKFASNLEFNQGTVSAKTSEVGFATIANGDKVDGALSRESSTNDASEINAKKLEDVVITEKNSKRSSKSSTLKSQTDVTNSLMDKVGYSDVGFTSSIIFGNEFDATLPKTCDISEVITKQLEDVAISEKKATKAKPLKSSMPKSRKKASNNKNKKKDFESTIIISGSTSAAAPKTSSASSLDRAKQAAKESEDDIHAEDKTESVDYNELDDVLSSEGVSTDKKEVSQETVLKSSVKTSQSKGENRYVKWADQRIYGALDDKKDIPQVAHEDLQSSIRFASAEACATALSQAAEAVASGEAEAGDAVSEAGIVILPQPQNGEVKVSEADEEAFEFERGVLKWPKKTVLLDTDMFDVEDSWHDTPPEGFSLTLSPFATMWMALFEWITCSSLAYIYEHDENSHEDFLSVNGREYPRKIFIKDGKSSEIRQALDGFICRALPGLVTDLKLPTPVSTIEKFVARLLDTMSFVDALPSFRMKQWQLIVLLFIEALSVHRLPSLAAQMTNRNKRLQKVLDDSKVNSDEYETMRDLIMPLGRSPQFSTKSSG